MSGSDTRFPADIAAELPLLRKSRRRALGLVRAIAGAPSDNLIST